MEERNEISTEERDYGAQILSLIRSDLSDSDIRERLSEYHENDIASIFEEITKEERERLFNILGIELMSDVVSYLDDVGEYLSEIDTDEVAEIIGHMDASDAYEALDELDTDTRSEVLNLIDDPEIKKDIELIGSYSDTEFGSRMSTNFIAVRRDVTIKEAMKTLVSRAGENDNIFTVFAICDDGSFYGAIDLKDLIVARSNIELESLIYKGFPVVYDTDIISEEIERLREYSENMIPVISSKDGTLLGVITSNEITALIDEERSDDYAKLAGLGAEEEPDESFL